MEKIRDIMRIKGVELEKGKLTTRIKNYISIILPLLINSLERSIQVGESLESRGFGISRKRTHYKIIKTNILEKIVILVNIITIIWLLYNNNLGQYFPFPKYNHPILLNSEGVLLTILTIQNIIIIFLLFMRWKIK